MNTKKTHYSPLFLVATLCLLLFSCSNTEEKKSLDHDIGDISVISSSRNGFSPKKGESFHWSKTGLWFDPSLRGLGMERYIRYIQQSIEQELLSRGLSLAKDEQSAQYVLGGAVVVANSASSRQLDSIFQLYPDVGRSAAGRGTAQLVLAMTRRGGRMSLDHMLWRGVAEVFVMGLDIDEKTRLRRMQHVVKQILETIP